MKALSIRQPWAWMILYAGKDIENREWPTRFRGRVLIHASKGMTHDEWEDAWEFAHGSGASPAAVAEQEICILLCNITCIEKNIIFVIPT